MSLSKTTVIESNSNPQFMIAAFELLKEKTLSRTTTFAKHTTLGISLVEKLNSSFFSPQTLFRSKTLSLHISCRNQAKLYFLMNEMTIDLNMLSSFMEHRIRSNMKDNLVVTPKFCWDGCLNADFHQELMKPHDLTHRLCHRSIFRLYTRWRDNTLFLILP